MRTKLDWIFLIFIFFEKPICLVFQEVPVIQTNVGAIKGLRATDGDYYMYMGIPYAMVDPSNPFGASKPYPPFKKKFEAYYDSAMCPQINPDTKTVMGTIDCLQLNVYVPTTVSTQTLPVMVWLYGGRFHQGYAGRNAYGPNYLVQNDVILVTLNYRLGPYGFFCLDIPEVPGNQGLKDQYLALKWIKNNIAAFGGEPDDVTVFGHSAGGHSIDLHLMSTQEVLFNKIILESGSALARTVLFEPDKLAPLKLARYTGFATNDIRAALLHLSRTDPKLVTIAATNLNIEFKPCEETVFDNVEPFIINSWINTKVPKVKGIPVLMGFNKDELAYSLYPKSDLYFRNLTIVEDYLTQVFDFSEQSIRETKDIVTRYYFGNEELSERLKRTAIEFASDFTYIHPVHRTLERYLENKAGNIYLYMFSYVGRRNAVVAYNRSSAGDKCCSSHGDEMAYLFNTIYKPEFDYIDYLMMKRMTTMWTNFAKFGDPTPETSELLPVKWKPITSTSDVYHFLNIDAVLSLGKRPLHERMAFWDLFYKHNKRAQKRFEEDQY